MTTDPIRALLLEMADELDHSRQCLLDDRRITHPLADRARALSAAPPEPVGEGEMLTDGPAVPEGREPASVMGEPSEEELLEEGPSLEEVEELCEEHCFNVEGYESIECLQGLINDALARWGRPAAPPAPLQGEVGEGDVLTDGPAVPEGREPASVTEELSDEELKAAYWEAFHESAMCGAEASWLAGLRAVAIAADRQRRDQPPQGEEVG